MNFLQSVWEWLTRLLSNVLGLVGAALTTSAALLILFLFLLDLLGVVTNPYVGILAYLILPAVFVVGLILIPIGAFRQRRKAARSGPAVVRGLPIIDLNKAKTSRALLVFIALSAFNLGLLAIGTIKGVHVLEDNRFCGTTCHVMNPEWTAFPDSPHAGANCVDCHVGPSTEWFLKAKLNGVTQVVSTLTASYHTPTRTPVDNMPPVSETCQGCHSSGQWTGTVPKAIARFEEDEPNTELTTILALHIGGTRNGESSGAHWHADPRRTLRFRADASRKNVSEVEVIEPDGALRRFSLPDADPAAAGSEILEWRTMDCTDCHNRAAHRFLGLAETVDRALLDKRVSRDLPYVRREAGRLLAAAYDSHESAEAAIRQGLGEFYAEAYPELAQSQASEIDRAATALASGYARSVFPAMNLGWDGYPDFRGHRDDGGCFRCHADLLETAGGLTISQDCELCHSVVAWDEPEPEALSWFRP